ncbi:MAG TPA: phage holin family protein [Ginsengibacter sp.]|nr:phage holin family protein [Chitinophagaceae bacterium]MCZ2397755.1 phage holin family protein [Chitinophagales bacterium]HRN73497.1 phage holin family protein [Ginsengibacter sp.]MCO5286691.1 phage holin family protein [Chitinophagaceae bacterium]MCW5915345.1 phage holin family protein [Chitinophagaceae bacterium]
MDQETESTPIEDLYQSVRDYTETQVELLKLKSVQKSAQLFSAGIVALILSILGLLVLILISIGLSFYLGKVLGSYHLGFFLTGAIYVILALIIFVFRKKLLQSSLSNWLIGLLLEESENEN